MKLVIRTVLVVTLLLTLGAFLGVFSPVTARAATPTPAATHTTTSPKITIVNCTDPNFLNLYSYTAGHWCFANSGYAPATIPNVTYVCGGNNNAYIFTQDYGTFYVGAGECRSLVPIITYGITVTGIYII